MPTSCPLCKAGTPHDTCQEVDRPIRFHSILVTGGDDGQMVVTTDLYPAGVQ